MTNSLEQLVRRGLREHAEAVAVAMPPAPVVTSTTQRGQIHRYMVPVFAAVIVTVIAILTPHLAPRHREPAGGDGVGLPSSLAAYSFLTADLPSAPIDRAIAVYRQEYEPLEDWVEFETHVLGADGDQYRRVGVLRGIGPDPVENMSDPVWLLAPDGRRLAARLFGGLILLDIGTGKVTRHALSQEDHIKLLGWSPDGTQLAYSLIEAGTLHLFSTKTATSTIVPRFTDTIAAAFSPDGTHLAVQTGTALHFVTMEGLATRGSLALAEDLRLINAVAWSPDGTLLALHRVANHPGYRGPVIEAVSSILFIDADTGDPAGQEYAYGYSRQYIDMLGWHTDRSIVVWFGDRLAEVAVDGSQESTLVTFPPDGVDYLQLAPGLLHNAAIREPGPIDRGPWPIWARVALGIGITMLVTPVLAIVLRRRLARRSAGRTLPGPTAADPHAAI